MRLTQLRFSLKENFFFLKFDKATYTGKDRNQIRTINIWRLIFSFMLIMIQIRNKSNELDAHSICKIKWLT